MAAEPTLMVKSTRMRSPCAEARLTDWSGRNTGVTVSISPIAMDPAAISRYSRIQGRIPAPPTLRA